MDHAPQDPSTTLSSPHGGGAEVEEQSARGPGEEELRPPGTAVILGPGPRIPGDELPAGLVPILGRSPLQRHAVHLARLGVKRCVVLLEDGPEVETLVEECRRQLARVPTGEMTGEVRVHAPDQGDLASLGEPALRMRAEGVYDPRLYRRMAGADPGAWLARGSSPEEGGQAGDLQPMGMSLGVPRSLDTPGPRGQAVTVDEIPAYLPSMRRHLPPYWCLVRNRKDRRRAGRMILDATQKGVLDFPARFLHPPPENLLVRLLAPTPVTPNQITALTGLIGFGAAWLFATDSYALGLAVAFLVNVLDGVDGKLARVKLQTSRFGDRLDHILDVLFEFSWYLGIGWGLSAGDPGNLPFLLALGLIGIMLANRAISGVYRLVSARQIHDHRAFDRAFRLVAGRRNIYVVILVVGLLVGLFPLAFALSVAWGALTLLVYCGRTALEALGWTGGGPDRI